MQGKKAWEVGDSVPPPPLTEAHLNEAHTFANKLTLWKTTNFQESSAPCGCTLHCIDLKQTDMYYVIQGGISLLTHILGVGVPLNFKTPTPFQTQNRIFFSLLVYRPLVRPRSRIMCVMHVLI